MCASVRVNRPVLRQQQVIDIGYVATLLGFAPRLGVCDHSRLGVGFGPSGGLGMNGKRTANAK